MTLKGGSSQACAACKYQRRKCVADCPLAPYFPPDQPKIFQNAHKLFGVSNILKILKNLDQQQKNEAMRSIIYQSNIRDKFPVQGCWGIICQLHYQIRQAEEELHAVHSHLDLYRHHHMSSSPDPDPAHLELGMAPPTTTNALLFHHHQQQQPYNVSFSNNTNTDTNTNAAPYNYNASFMECNKDNMWIQHQSFSNSNNNNSNSLSLQCHQLPPSQEPITFQQEVVQEDYDEIHPFFDSIDDRQSYIDSKDPYDSSSESSLKDTTQSIEHVAENELKSAAACFSLTSVN